MKKFNPVLNVKVLSLIGSVVLSYFIFEFSSVQKVSITNTNEKSELSAMMPIMHVDSSVTTSGDGSSWADAFKTLQEAITFANNNPGVVSAIYIAKGTYYADGAPGAGSDSRGSSFVFDSTDFGGPVAVYAGFPSGGGTEEERNSTCNPVILSGEIQQDASVNNNAYHVLRVRNGSTTFYGLNITGGNATGANILDLLNRIGGGIYNSTSSVFLDCNIYGNRAAIDGGGVYNQGFLSGLAGGSMTPAFINCKISGNTASSGGGGVYNNGFGDGNVIANFVNTIVSGNRAVLGGGMFNNCNGGSISVNFVNSIAIGNLATGTAFGVGIGTGGGFYNAGVVSESCILNVHNSIVWNNDANARVANLRAPAIRVGPNTVTNVQNSIIQGTSNNLADTTITNPTAAGTINNNGGNKFQSDGVNPMFKSVITAASAPTTAGNFHVLSTSPVINMGNNTLYDNATIFPGDLDYMRRKVGTSVDIGPYEYAINCNSFTIPVDANGEVNLPVDSFAFVAPVLNEFEVLVNGTNIIQPPFTYQLDCDNLGENTLDVIIRTGCAPVYDTLASCTKTVTVIDTFPSPLTVIAEVNLSLDTDCEAIVTPETVLTGVFGCFDEYTVTLEYPVGTNTYSPANQVDETHVGKKVKFIISLADGNSAWGYINVEDKQCPIITGPEDVTVSCIIGKLDDNGNPHIDITGDISITNLCSPYEKRGYIDETQELKCGDGNNVLKQIRRIFTIQNASGTICRDTQNITVIAIYPATLNCPEAFVEIECSTDDSPSGIAAYTSDSTDAWPYYEDTIGFTKFRFYLPENKSVCNVIATYNDIVIPVCKPNCIGTVKKARTWTILDWCVGTSRQCIQVIKKVDNKGPVISGIVTPAPYSVNAWGCDVDITLPSATVKDNCDPDAQLVEIKDSLGLIVATKTASGWRALKVPCGRTKFYYTASDCCGNTSRDSVVITVVDRVAPVATAKEFITVSLTRSGDATVTGVAKVYAEQVDNGSYDNCTKVYLEVRREDGSPKCLNEGKVIPNTGGTTYNNNLTYNDVVNGLDQVVPRHLNDSEFDTDLGQYVKFCCEDIGKEVKVWLRVWDDASKDGIFGNAGDNYNETWTNVKVEDKSIPKIFCKPDVEVSCDRDTGIVTEYNFTSSWVSVTGKVPSSLVPTAESVCNTLEFEFQDRGSLTVCNTGTFTRTYRIKSHPTISCTQVITVGNQVARPQLEWPVVLHEWNKCTLSVEDVENNTVRARINVGRELDWEGCYKRMSRSDEGASSRDGNYCLAADVFELCIDGTGSAAQWNEDPALPYNVIPSNVRTCNNDGGRPAPASTVTSNPTTPAGYPRFNSNYKDPGCNVFGKKIYIEEYTVGEGCRKWLVRWDYINWCCNEKSACRETIYKYEDKTAPEIVNCPGDDQDITDGSCVITSVLNPVAVDSGGCEAGLTWRVRIYPNNKTATGNNYLEIIHTGYDLNSRSATTTTRLTGTSPVLTITNIPAGEHGVRYLVTDGCGNVRECTSVIGVWPKAATPYCVSLSSAVMKNGLVELWAKDFDKGSFTNCGNRAMYFTFNRGGNAEHPVPDHLDRRHIFTGMGVLEAVLEGPDRSSQAVRDAAWAKYNAGEAQMWLPDVTVRPRPTLPNGDPQPDERIVTGGTSGMQFGCKAASGLGPVTVEMRVWDSGRFKAGTTQGSDFCSTRLTLIDNLGGCGEGTLVSLGGVVQTEGVEMMGNVELLLKAELPEYTQSTKTNEEGKYEFKNLPINIDYSIEAKKENDYLNGVNTLDLVQIQRHILGIQKLSNPYKMIAADADGDKAIRVNDIVTLRKMILGITDKIEGMPSWRFVDASDRMENGPWPFREVISHVELHEEAMKNNFIGVKLGDVDGTASVNAVSKTTQPRNEGVRLTAEEREVKAGEEIEVILKAATFTEVYGMQMSMSHAGMELVSAEGRAIEMTGEHIGKVRNDLTTVSWSSDRAKTAEQGSEVMKLTFRAVKGGKLSEMLQITSEVTNAEAYTGSDMERSGVSLDIRGRDELQFVIYQNEPNPWKTSTMIRYDLPEAGAVKVTISDITGRIIRTYDSKGNAGENTLNVTREQLNGATGIMIYKIESGSFNAQKKMMVVE